MTETWIEDRFRRLVDGVEAPATSMAFKAIEGRQRDLRRRRRVGVVVVAGVVMATVAGVALRRGSPALEIDPAEPRTEDGAEGGLPALTLDLDGWEVTAASDEHDVPFGLGPPPPGDDSTEAVQVFRQPGELTGPTIYLRHDPGEAPNMDRILPDEVMIGGVRGRAWVFGDDVTMSWNLHDGHTNVWLRAAGGLTLDQVLEFAEGLQPRDGNISLPPSPSDRFGFEATISVAGLAEEPAAAQLPTIINRRQVTLSNGTANVQIEIDDAGLRAFEDDLGGLLGTREHVTVADRPAVLFPQEIQITDTRTMVIGELRWMHTTTSRVMVHFTFVDPTELDDILDGIHQIPEHDWNELVAAAPSSTTTILTP
jgi:hypothetical protein